MARSGCGTNDHRGTLKRPKVSSWSFTAAAGEPSLCALNVLSPLMRGLYMHVDR